MWRIGHKMDWDELKRCCNWQKRFVALRASSLLPHGTAFLAFSCPKVWDLHADALCGSAEGWEVSVKKCRKGLRGWKKSAIFATWRRNVPMCSGYSKDIDSECFISNYR